MSFKNAAQRAKEWRDAIPAIQSRQRFNITTETYFNGIRIAPGEYLLIRTDDPQEVPRF